MYLDLASSPEFHDTQRRLSSVNTGRDAGRLAPWDHTVQRALGSGPQLLSACDLGPLGPLHRSDETEPDPRRVAL